MTTAFRLRDSQLLFDTYQSALLLMAKLEDMELTTDDLSETLPGFSNALLVSILSCYIESYNKLLENELAISSTKQLIQSTTVH